MSIINFELFTEDLTEQELAHSNDVKSHLEAILYGPPVKQPDVVAQLNMRIAFDYGGQPPINITSEKLRKYFNYFRSYGILPIIATSSGCYLSQDKEEVLKQVQSLEERARQIQRAADGLKKFLL